MDQHPFVNGWVAAVLLLPSLSPADPPLAADPSRHLVYPDGASHPLFSSFASSFPGQIHTAAGHQDGRQLPGAPFPLLLPPRYASSRALRGKGLSSPGPWSFLPREVILLEQRLVVQSTWRPWISTRPWRQDLWIPVPACSWDVLHSLGCLGLAP